MRRITLLLASMALMLGVAAPVAWAATIQCPDPDTIGTCFGTRFGDLITGDVDEGDTIAGLAGSDDIFGLGGNDEVFGGGGSDYIEGNAGNDILRGEGGADEIHGNAGNDQVLGGGGQDFIDVSGDPTFIDRVSCGAGTDTVFADPNDIVNPDCENVTRVT
jgi:Ca2+-binding RTX toxin-like protein